MLREYSSTYETHFRFFFISNFWYEGKRPPPRNQLLLHFTPQPTSRAVQSLRRRSMLRAAGACRLQLTDRPEKSFLHGEMGTHPPSLGDAMDNYAPSLRDWQLLSALARSVTQHREPGLKQDKATDVCNISQFGVVMQVQYRCAN